MRDEMQMLAEAIEYHAGYSTDPAHLARMLVSDGWVELNDGSGHVNQYLDASEPAQPLREPAQLSAKWRHLNAVRDEGQA